MQDQSEVKLGYVGLFRFPKDFGIYVSLKSIVVVGHEMTHLSKDRFALSGYWAESTEWKQADQQGQCLATDIPDLNAPAGAFKGQPLFERHA
jgi:hypothetical protein